MERVERIKHLNVRGFWAQGIVSADAIIPTSIVSSPPADYPRTANAGGAPARSSSFCQRSPSAGSSVVNSFSICKKRSPRAGWRFMANFANSLTPSASKTGHRGCSKWTGWFASGPLSAGPIRCFAISRATLTASPSLMADCSPSRPVESASAGATPGAATRSKKCRWTPWSSFAASYCMCCPAASSRYDTSVSCRTETERQWFRTAGTYCLQHSSCPSPSTMTTPSARFAESDTCASSHRISALTLQTLPLSTRFCSWTPHDANDDRS